MAALFERDKSTISRHIKNVFEEGELTRDSVVANFATTAAELQRLNLLVSQFLDFAELQALEERPMSMQDWISALDRLLAGNGCGLLSGRGTVSHQQAVARAEQEFARYRAKEMSELESDFDRMIRQLENQKDSRPENGSN